jgi:transposase
MEETLRMSELERDRLVALEQVRQGSLSLAEASGRLGLSYRQAKRVWRRYRDFGAAGLVHCSRSRPSNRSPGAEFRAQCLAEYSARLEGLGPTLTAENLSAWGYAVDHETLRRWLVGSGLWQPQGRRGPRHRRRERRERFGELVQLDGSFHAWFARGGEAHRDCLMTLIDDATGQRRSLLSAEETTADALTLLSRWIEQFGVPRALYTDRKSVYVTERPPTVDEQLAGVLALTAFGWACHRLRA